jgi:ribose transport system substrate-binding protein
LTLAGAACGGSDGPAQRTESIRVAFFAPGLANTYIPAQIRGAEAAAEARGASVTVFDAVFDSSKQVTQVQDAVASGRFDAFVIHAVDGNALVPQIEAAIEAGIEVACVSAPCGPDLTSLEPQVEGLTVHVGHSFVTSGTLIGEQIVAACAERDPCKVAYLPGLYSYPSDRIRTEAVHTRVERDPTIEIVAEQEGKYLAEAARAALQNILQAHRDVDVVATTGDQMAFGMEQAIKAAGLEGEVEIIGNGASEVGVSAVKSGRWHATIVLLPYTEGRVSTDSVIRAAHGAVGLPTSVDMEKLSPIGPVATRDSARGFEPEWRG